MHKTHFSI